MTSQPIELIQANSSENPAKPAINDWDLGYLEDLASALTRSAKAMPRIIDGLKRCGQAACNSDLPCGQTALLMDLLWDLHVRVSDIPSGIQGMADKAARGKWQQSPSGTGYFYDEYGDSSDK